MNLEDLARDAAEELRARSVPDLAGSFENLRRARNQRNAHRAIAVAVTLLLVGGGAALVSVDHGAKRRAYPLGPGPISNGALVGSDNGGVAVLRGHLDALPQDAEKYSPVQFTADGTELVYARHSGGLVAMNVITGLTRFLTPCRAINCRNAQLSPDGTRIAKAKTVAGRVGVEVRNLQSGVTAFVPTHSHGFAWPRWAPDGTSLVFVGRGGLYLVPAKGGPVRLLHQYPPGTYPEPASWSPDGSTIAFLQPRPVKTDPHATAWTLMTVKPDGTSPHRLRNVGVCGCVGLSPPALAWSPDGRQIAVTVINNSGRTVTDASAGGLYVINPDGTGWTAMSPSVDVAQLAWQPLPSH